MKRPHAHICHTTHEEIAAFIEGSTAGIRATRIRAHLQSCEHCREAYQYAQRYRGMHNELPADDTPGREAIRAAKAVAQRGERSDRRVRPGRRRWIAALTPAGRVAFSAVVVAAVTASVFLVRPRIAGGDFDPYSRELAPVTTAMVTASERSRLVLPGAERDLGPAPATVRSGTAPITRELDHALSTLAVSYNGAKVSSDEAQWLIAGYLATGQVENARVYVGDARRRFPADKDLVVLEGILAFSDDDLDKAAGLFEFVLAEEPDNAVAAFNLAVVRSESSDRNGSPDAQGARQMYERVQAISPASPLAARAEAGLAAIR